MSEEQVQNTALAAEDENHIIAERRAKLLRLREKGVAYPNDFHREDLFGDLRAKYGEMTAEELEAIRQAYEKALEGTEIGTLGLQLDYNEEGYFELTLNPWTVDILFKSGNYAMTDAHVNFEDFALNLIVRTGIEVDDSWKPAEGSNYVPLFGESGTVEA